MRLPGFLCLFLALPGFGQLPDLDGLGDGLDWSVLTSNRVVHAEASDASARLLEQGLAGIPTTLRETGVAIDSNRVLRLELPAASTLVAADPAHVADGYARMADVIERGLVLGQGPLHVAVHADNKFSVALPLANRPDGALPLGLDLSPLPQRRFAGLWMATTEARRDDTRVLAAVRRIRMDIEASGERADLAELYFFPGPPGMAFVALGIQSP